MREEITLKRKGIRVKGTAYLKEWGGGKGNIEMDTVDLIGGKITKERILKCINDAGFGCEEITGAYIDIYELYEDGYARFNRTIAYKEVNI